MAQDIRNLCQWCKCCIYTPLGPYSYRPLISCRAQSNSRYWLHFSGSGTGWERTFHADDRCVFKIHQGRANPRPEGFSCGWGTGERVVYHCGVPAHLHSDQGRSFQSALFQTAQCKLYEDPVCTLPSPGQWALWEIQSDPALPTAHPSVSPKTALAQPSPQLVFSYYTTPHQLTGESPHLTSLNCWFPAGPTPQADSRE